MEKSYAEQGAIEDALFVIRAALDQTQEVEVRVRQAIQRTRTIAPVLEPAVERLEKIQLELAASIVILAALWEYRRVKRGDYSGKNRG